MLVVTLHLVVGLAQASAWSSLARFSPHLQAQRFAPPRAALPMKSAAASFSVDTAVLAAGFAFEAYNEPSETDARWERGADGCDVAFMSDDFAREVYAGVLEVRLIEAKELEPQQQLAQALFSGSNRDPFVIFAMNEENEQGPKEGAIGLGKAVDRATTSTVWSQSLADQWKSKVDEGCAVWPEDERVYLYVKDPRRAQLALTVFDEEVLAQDIPLGATSLRIADLLGFDGAGKPERPSWSGWVPLNWRPEETQDNTVLIGTVAGAAVAGPLGAVAGAALGNLIKKPVQGQLRLELKYTPLTADSQVELRRRQARLEAARRAEDGEADSDADDQGGGDGEGEGEAAFTATLTNFAAPRGGSEGIDWSMLSRRVGTVGKDENAQYELCCFLTHRETSSEVAIWRDRSRRLVVVAFRGTSDILDVLTDVNFVQQPLESGFQGQKSDDPRKACTLPLAAPCLSPLTPTRIAPHPPPGSPLTSHPDPHPRFDSHIA